jgi:hypothetical protein
MADVDIARARLFRQGIADPTFEAPAQVVAHLGAVQAQDYPAALWAVGLRTAGATWAEVERAIAQRQIVRTWPMRGTLHFVAPADVRWLLELLTPRIVAGMASRHRQLGLEAADFARGRELAGRALEGGEQLTRAEMYDGFERGGVSPAGQRGIHILGVLAQQGLICFGPHRGKQPTFVLLEEWVPKARRLEREEALAELAKRYFSGHGPATLQDFVWWSGLKVADARAGLDAVAAELAQETVDGATYWSPRDFVKPREAPPAVHLLPAFDEYLVGYKDRSAALDPAHSQTIQPGGNGIFSPVIVRDGEVVGVWRRAIQKNTLEITAKPFAKLGAAEAGAFAAAAERYGRFLDLRVAVSGG